MGNRSRFVAAGAALAGGAGLAAMRKARRRERLGEAVEGIAETILPSVAEDEPRVEPVAGADEAHAPGHTHLGPPQEGRPRARGANKVKRGRHGWPHPGRPGA